ncbi:Alpha/Beta hydrolase protein [Auriculariales sp. MPI-PUGE-AT-0066]|nr:Alpha/Beta hydrolase protein [Auriculariales sp. MPI-PUGE-AT-0066]
MVLKLCKILQAVDVVNPITLLDAAVEVALGQGNGKPTVSQETFDTLVHYFKYSSSSFLRHLPKTPLVNGSNKIYEFRSSQTYVAGYIAVDHSRHEIVLVFRSTANPMNVFNDCLIYKVDLQTPTPLPGAEVHYGFQKCWLSVSHLVRPTLDLLLATHPRYTLVLAGHSLGGAISSIASLTLKQLYPHRPMRLYTYGQPRTGNENFARAVTDTLGPANIFRVVRSNDGVPALCPRTLGFKHHGTEYWVLDPPLPTRTFVCNAAGIYDEDPHGSNSSVLRLGVNLAHMSYFGIPGCMPFRD